MAGKTRKKQLKQRKSANEGVLSPKEELDRLLGGDSEKIREEMMRDLQETNFKESSSSAISFVPMSKPGRNKPGYEPVHSPFENNAPTLPSYPARSSMIAHGQNFNYITKSKSMSLPTIHDIGSGKGEDLGRSGGSSIIFNDGMNSAIRSQQSMMYSTMLNGATEKIDRYNQTIESQKQEIRTLKTRNKELTLKVAKVTKRADYLEKKSKEFQSAAIGNSKSAIKSETAATVHAANAKAFKNKYLSVQRALEVCREEHDRIAEEEDRQQKIMQQEKRRLGGAFKQGTESLPSKMVKEGKNAFSAASNSQAVVRDSRKSAEKAYKRALMLLVREKENTERKFSSEHLLRTRVQKKNDELESRLERAHAEIKRLRTLYKTAQKQLESQRPPTDPAKLEKEEKVKRRPPRIMKQPPLNVLMSKVFSNEPTLLRLLEQAKEDGDADEIARAITRCRALMTLSDHLARAKTLEKVATTIVDFLPNAMECEYAVVQMYDNETETFWTVPRRSGERGYFPSSKKSIAAVTREKESPVNINDCNYDSRFHIDLEVDGVFGTVNTRCTIAAPVVVDGCEDENGSPTNTPSKPVGNRHRTRSMSLASKSTVIAVLQAFNKNLRPNTGLHSDDLAAQAAAATFEHIDEAFMAIASKSVSRTIVRVQAEMLVEKQFSYLRNLASMTHKCFRKYLPAVPSIESIDPIRLATSIEEHVSSFLRVEACRIFIVGAPPGHPSLHPASGPLGSTKLELALKSREQVKAIGLAIGSKYSKATSRHSQAMLKNRKQMTQRRMFEGMLKVWHAHEELNLTGTDQSNLVRRFTDLFTGISGNVLATKKHSVVRDAYNDPLFNGNSDLHIQGADLISVPIEDWNSKTIGVLQVAITDLTQLDYLSEMSPVTPSVSARMQKLAELKILDERTKESSSDTSDEDSSADESTWNEKREKERQDNISRYLMEMKATKVVEDAAAKIALLLVHYRDVSRAVMHNVLDNEDELVRLFKLWKAYQQQIELEKKVELSKLSLAERKKVERQEQTNAAKRIQKFYRRHLKRIRQEKIAKLNGAIQMQRIVRGHLGRLKVQKLREFMEAEQDALWNMAENRDGNDDGIVV